MIKSYKWQREQIPTDERDLEISGRATYRVNHWGRVFRFIILFIIISAVTLSCRLTFFVCCQIFWSYSTLIRKRLADEASRFHLGRQRQHSAVICSGTLLFRSRVLRPSLVTLCSHKSGRCAVELNRAPHLWYPPFYTSPMASSAVQHWTASPTKEGCHWQAGGENRQTW